jgi:hypothetical protein
VPEVATILFSNGVTHTGLPNLQEVIMRLQMSLENSFHNLGKNAQFKTVVLLCDRGLMDGLAYCSPEEFQDTLDTVGLKLTDARDVRYHAVIHLETAAKNAVEFYTTSNNVARIESPVRPACNSLTLGLG